MTDRRRKKRPDEQQQEYREQLKPKTAGHAEYLRCMAENMVTFCTGPAGSSKSYSSIGLGCQYLLEKRVDRLILTRPCVEAAPKSIGMLPGGILDKVSPYLAPAINHAQKFLGKNTYNNMRAYGQIAIEPLEFMRGHTFDGCFIICEESQNCTTEQLIMLVTRLGQNSRLVINGDIFQTDIPDYDSDYSTDFEYVVDKVERANLKNFGVCHLHEEDIMRNSIIGPFLKVFRK